MSQYYGADYKDPLSLKQKEPSSSIEISGSGGGGSCFPASTLIKTFKGWRPIDLIAIGEKVISYDRYSLLNYGWVTEKHTHSPKTAVDKLYFIYCEALSLFPQGITGNHAVYDATTKEHKEIQTFQIGEFLTDVTGLPREITQIVVRELPQKNTYNLTILPQHTYIAGEGIRVHNGGGGKGKSKGAVEAPNTLRSSAIAQVQEVISHGEIIGVVGGLQGVYLNNTAVLDASGNPNFTESKNLPEKTQLDLNGNLFKSLWAKSIPQGIILSINKTSRGWHIQSSAVLPYNSHAILRLRSKTKESLHKIRDLGSTDLTFLKEPPDSLENYLTTPIVLTFVSKDFDLQRIYSTPRIAHKDKRNQFLIVLNTDLGHRFQGKMAAIEGLFKTSLVQRDTRRNSQTTLRLAYYPRHGKVIPQKTRGSLTRELNLYAGNALTGYADGGYILLYSSGTRITTTASFFSINFYQRVGLPEQKRIPGYNTVEAEQSGFSQELFSVSSGIIKEIPRKNIAHARVTFRLPQGLWVQNTKTGNLSGSSLTIELSTRALPTGRWSIQQTYTVNGKATTSYDFERILDHPTDNISPWAIRAIKVTKDNDSVSVGQNINWVRITEIRDISPTYDKIAYTALSIPAEMVGNSIPTRGYHVMGIKIEVPRNYDPLLRTYGNTYWDGRFKTAWSDNPAWVLYDLLTNPEYGAYQQLNHTLDIDIYAFYEAALYCDAVIWKDGKYIYKLLDDGQGGTEVRYTFNSVISVQKEAWQLLQAIASCMRAVVVQRGGQVSLIQDRPQTPTRVITNANVVQGLFSYSSLDRAERVTAINCTFNDKLDRYLPRTISEELPDKIARYGLIEKEIIAYGAVTESQARRLARSELEIEDTGSELVTFSLALNILSLEVGTSIVIGDNSFVTGTSKYVAGKVISSERNILHLDRKLEISPSHNYIFGMSNQERTDIIKYPIVKYEQKNTSSSIIVEALPREDFTGREFYIYSVNYLDQKEYIILNILEEKTGIYGIKALLRDPTKYDRIDTGIQVAQAERFSLLPTRIPAVTDIKFRELSQSTKMANETTLLVSWSWEGKGLVAFRLHWRKNAGAFSTVNDIPLKEVEIPATTPGLYEVRIEAYSLQGKVSLGTRNEYSYREESILSTLLPPENFRVKGSTEGTSILLIWDYPIENDTQIDRLKEYSLSVFSQTNSDPLFTIRVPFRKDKGGEFEYTLAQNMADFGAPQREVQFRVASIDLTDDVSSEVRLLTQNAIPEVQDFSLVSTLESTFIHILSAPPIDLAGYVIHKLKKATETPTEENMVYQGTNTLVTILGEAGHSFFKVAAYDTFQSPRTINYGELNYGTGKGTTIHEIPPATTPPTSTYNFTNILFAPNSPDKDKVSWTAGSVINSTTVDEVYKDAKGVWKTRVIKKGATTELPIEAGQSTQTASEASPLYIYYVPSEGDT